MKCSNCGANVKDGADFCTSCGTKLVKVDMNQIFKSDFPDLFKKNTELMTELMKNFEEQKTALNITEEYMLGVSKEVDAAKAETAEIQKKLDETEALLQIKLELILEKEREIVALQKQIDSMPVKEEPQPEPVTSSDPGYAPMTEESNSDNQEAKEESIPVAEGEVVDQALKCPNCGNDVKPGMAFCNLCGTKLNQ